MLKVGDIIKFRNHPKLNVRHTYLVLEITDDIVHFQNTNETARRFRDTIVNLTNFGATVVGLSEQHAQIVRDTKALRPKIPKCKHTKQTDRFFATFSIRQCEICKADLGDAKTKK